MYAAATIATVKVISTAPVAAPAIRLDATGAFRILSANLWQRSGYDDDRGTVGSTGEAQQRPDGGIIG